MINFVRNNLDRSSSPYLKQHKDNPVNWQEWSNEALAHAKKHKKLVFVSIGYATCHWCHVMAREAFSDKIVADTLNANFISIKVDREQRPDIDRYFMDFIVQTQGHGGWPLNVVLTPDGAPIYALTYLPAHQERGMPSLVDILTQVLDWYQTHDSADVFSIEKKPISAGYEQSALLKQIERNFDRQWGGFGMSTKFPPHTTLLLLMVLYEQTKDATIQSVITKTLDVMATRGLHDHLQGGFYRYCVDRAWTIPHFEKMLYDQAMHLWVYSWGFQLFKKEAYRTIVEKLLYCLKETFQSGDVFVAAHDADTDHVEGKTYVWSLNDIKATLSADQFSRFNELYDVSADGNFEGQNHLIKKELKFLPKIEHAMLNNRKQRLQPFTDKKIITSWNALVGIGLIMAYRYGGIAEARDDANRLFKELINRHRIDGRLIHSSFGKGKQEQGFLEDYASMLLLATYLKEERLVDTKVVKSLFESLQTFRESDIWYTNTPTDFKRIPADDLDSPTPSPTALALTASWRAARILDIDYDQPPPGFGAPTTHDFFSMGAYLSGGRYHEIHSPELLGWSKLPINCMQFQGSKYQDCYLNFCREFASKAELIIALGYE